jgi:hypothetical protein
MDGTPGNAQRIDCDECVMDGTEVCDDCVVTFLCRAAGEVVVLEPASARALRLLSDGGLVPRLRHRPRSEGDHPGAVGE